MYKKLNKIFCIVLMLVLLAPVLAQPLKANSLSYKAIYKISTENIIPWGAEDGTICEINKTLRSNNNVISAKPAKIGLGAVSISASINSSWDFVVDETKGLALRFMLYINDISLFCDNKGVFLGGSVGFSGDDILFEWPLSDLNLSSGWNRLILNFRTAKISLKTETEKEVTEETENPAEANPDIEGKPTEDTQKEENPTENTPKEENKDIQNYSYRDTGLFFISMQKQVQKTNMFFALENVEIVTLTVNTEETVISEPEYNEYSKDILLISVIIACVLIIFVVFEAVHFTKKRKARLRKRRKKKKVKDE